MVSDKLPEPFSGDATWLTGQLLIAMPAMPDPRFARYAAGAFAVAVASGVLLAVAHTATFAALVSTDYGWALLVKVAVVGVALVTAVLRRRRWELGAAIAVVASAALLAALPPSR